MTKSSKAKFKRYLPLFLMVLPGLIYLIINNYIPMAGLHIAFKDINLAEGLFSGEWVGIENFRFLFQTKDAWIITRNTIFYNGAFIIFTNIAAIAFAILLNEITNRVLARFYQSIVLLPRLISWVIVSYIVYSLLSTSAGFINNTIMPVLGMNDISWYNDSKYWPYILTLIKMWKDIGYFSIIYFASIIGISNEYYEAAVLDGASKWQQIRHITIPLISPTIIMLVLIGIGRIFYADFGLFYLVPRDSGMIYNVTNVIDTYVYRSMMHIGDVGMSAAAGFYQSIVGFVLVLSANWVIRKINRESALF